MPGRGLKTSRVPVVWAIFGIFSTMRVPNNFLSRLVTMDETWLCHYDSETKRQLMEWRHSGSPGPHRPKKSAGKSSGLDFFGSTWQPPHWLSSKWSDYQRGVLLISAGAIEGHFEGKPPWEFHQGCLVPARQYPGSLGTCNPEETDLLGLPMSWLPTLFSGPSPVGQPSGPWTEKKTIERSPFFIRRGSHSCRGDLVGRTTFWIF